jgi:hypothetical protein
MITGHGGYGAAIAESIRIAEFIANMIEVRKTLAFWWRELRARRLETYKQTQHIRYVLYTQLPQRIDCLPYAQKFDSGSAEATDEK